MNTYHMWCDDCQEAVDSRLHSHANFAPYLIGLCAGVVLAGVYLVLVMALQTTPDSGCVQGGVDVCAPLQGQQVGAEP